MPVDQKRVNGPEASTPYNIYIHTDDKNEDKQCDGQKRQDGRSNDEIRNICKILL